MEPDHQVRNPLNSCPICLEDIIANEVFSQLDSCNHHLCQPCFKQLIGYSDNCPLCGIRFSGCFYIKDKNIIHQHFMTDVDLENVKKNKNSFYHGKIFNINSFTEENFDCFTKEEISIELRHYQKLAEIMKVNLFMQRNSDGSQREYKIIHDVMENLEISKKEVNSNVYNSKTVMKNLDLIINGIKDLQQRKYRDDNMYECEDEVIYFGNDCYNIGNNSLGQNYVGMMYSIEYVDKKKSGSRKRKR